MLRDSDIRELLLPQLSLQNENVPCLIVEELGLNQGDARIDIAVVSGHLHGYEIKSERDSLRRLHRQERVYSQVLDYVTVVAAVRHLSRLEAWVPAWWGITVVDSTTLSLSIVKPASPNPQVSPEALVQLLWRKEAMQLLQRIDPSLPHPRATRREIWLQIMESVSLDELKREVREALRSRRFWRNSHPITAAASPPTPCGDL